MKRELRRRSPPSSTLLCRFEAANDIWCIDFKGWFLHRRRHALRAADALRRAQPLSVALPGAGAHRHRACVAAARRRLPRVRAAAALRSDNGPPFASLGAGGLSQARRQRDQGRRHAGAHRSRQPQQNGRLERLHLTLLQDAASPPARSLREQRERLRGFQQTLQRRAPARSARNDTPAEHYAPSPRRFDGVLREPHYAPTTRSGACAQTARSSGGSMIYIASPSSLWIAATGVAVRQLALLRTRCGRRLPSKALC